jgi:hypothetical protein
VQYSNLTDDALWRAVTKNTNAMLALFDQQLEAGTNPLPQTGVARAIDKLERQYQDYAAELRRRHPLVAKSETPTGVGSDRAG